MKKILLLWYMEGDNYGDVLLSETTTSYLENEYIIENHEVGDSVGNIAEHGNKCDFILFAGGGIIERYVPSIIRKIREFRNLCDKKYAVMGLSVGEFDYSEYKQDIKYWMDNAEFFFVRDEETMRVLNELSESKKAIYTADCVFANNRIIDYVRNNRNMYGINVRNMPYIDLTGDLDWSYLNDIRMKYSLDMIIPDASRDIDKIVTKKEEDSIEKYRKMSVEDKINFTTTCISKCDYILAMRFHVILVAAMLGVPTIAIKYCPKVTQLVKQLGIEELSINAEEVYLFSEKKKYLDDNREKIEEKIKRNTDVMIKRAKEMYSCVIEEINNILKEG